MGNSAFISSFIGNGKNDSPIIMNAVGMIIKIEAIVPSEYFSLSIF